MSRRCKLGNVYAEYPAKTINRWLLNRTFKVIATIAIAIGWVGVYSVGLGIFVFLNNNILPGAKKLEFDSCFNSITSYWLIGIGMAVILFLVLKGKK